MPKIIGSTLAEHRQQVRQKLFTALAELMGERGFDSVTLAQIAARAKVGRTSVYNHFPDKEALLLAFIEHETGEFVTNMRAALVGVEDPEEQLRVYVRAQLLLQHPYHFAPGPSLASVVSRDTVARLGEHVREVAQLLRSILSAGIEHGGLPEQDVSAVVPLIHSCLQSRTLPLNPVEREQAIETITAFVLRAVGAREVTAA
ncbi:TetR/AcrR family transcriptional regulator [Pseudactinotalea sp. HY158]|uniref:TetR/AcrR family transcriptional regulator n=1 Tax=unclassified Pseudactinotalea TaxID=2649176 RepID=UPI00129CE510|nr:TetR/AcrR family transcriptional regulator [Pseudactinotalea sp. HY158]MPV50579.1 TetR family transcriptional regulator [Pseudactinotalea sp. HY160]QGH70737.1 TetR family transcriptional regulator [Pseudactinotalea sp. HY158]